MVVSQNLFPQELTIWLKVQRLSGTFLISETLAKKLALIRLLNLRRYICRMAECLGRQFRRRSAHAQAIATTTPPAKAFPTANSDYEVATGAYCTA